MPATSHFTPLLRVCFVLLALVGGSALGARDAAVSGPPTEPPPALSPEVLANRPTQPPPTEPPEAAPDPAELLAQLELLQEFLNLSPAELERVRNTITMIERLSPEERAQMRIRLAAMQVELRQMEGSFTTFESLLAGRLQSDFRRFWISLPPHERMRLRHQFDTLPEEERSDWLTARVELFQKHEASVIQRLQASAR